MVKGAAAAGAAPFAAAGLSAGLSAFGAHAVKLNATNAAPTQVIVTCFITLSIQIKVMSYSFVPDRTDIQSNHTAKTICKRFLRQKHPSFWHWYGASLTQFLPFSSTQMRPFDAQ
jgi:hypothetical protein